jgi:hypothetical protein
MSFLSNPAGSETVRMNGAIGRLAYLYKIDVSDPPSNFRPNGGERLCRCDIFRRGECNGILNFEDAEASTLPVFIQRLRARSAHTIVGFPSLAMSRGMLDA